MSELIEYGDFECPYCAKAATAIREVRGQLGDALSYEFRHFPLWEKHPHALRASLAAEAARRQDAFAAMHDALFADQAHLEDADLVAKAVAIGLDEQRFRADLDDPAVEAIVREQHAEGEARGVSGTPAFFVDGERYTGFYDADSLIDLLG